MYTTVLVLHSWLRWVVLVSAFGATFAALGKQPPVTQQSRADRWGLILMMTTDLQMLFGLLLYLALSPFTAEAMRDFGAAMRTPQLRFWAVEHLTLMLVAVVLVHVGRVLGRKATTPRSKRTRLALCFGLATIAMVAATPWPGMANGRPLFRV